MQADTALTVRAPRKRDVERVAWLHMLHRCYNPKSANFRWYGARGISVCQRWRESFEAFLDDMGRKPSPAHSLDRIDNDGNYEPGNCRWSTHLEQMQNTRSNHYITHDGMTLSLSEWARRIGVSHATIRMRLRYMSPERALEMPKQPVGGRRGLPACRRVCTSATGYKGVYACGRRFAAQIKHGNKLHYLGLYPTPEAAARAYNRAATELFGEFARLNEVLSTASLTEGID